jgi:recombination DNA repair RAD52 pathway protein
MSEETISQQERLNEEFPAEQIKDVQGFDYISVGDVIRRMNDVLTTGGWSTQIVSKEYFPESQEIVAQVLVTATIDGKHCTADGFGGAAYNKRGMGDQYKSASSDALKKACQRLGVGLHLAVDDLPEEVVPRVAQVDADSYANLNAFVSTLSDEQKAELREWWSMYGSEKYNIYDIDPEVWSEYTIQVKTYKDAPVQEELSADDVADALDGEVV